MIIQYRYNMKMTHVIKLLHTHTKKKKQLNNTTGRAGNL